MKKIFFLLLISHCSLLIAHSQIQQDWVARYNGPGNDFDYAYSLAVDGSGNVYVTGWSWASGTYWDYGTIKYNSSGVQQWVAMYNGPGNDYDYARSLAADGSGNVFVTGYSTGSGTYLDYATIKYNSSGVQQWVSRYNGPGNGLDYAYSLAADGSGNVYVTGQSAGIGTGFDYATIKYNSSGVQQWVQRYNGPGNGNDFAYALAADGSGNVYVTGGSTGIGTLSDYATIKYNSSGVQQWEQRYNGPENGNDFAYSLAVDGLGNVYVTGWSGGSGTGFDYGTIKYNSSGVQQWVSRYNGPGNDYDEAYSLAVDGSGNLYVTGWSIGSGTFEDYATIKYNSSGVQQWVQRYNGPGNYYDYAYSLAVDGSGNVYVTGRSYGSGTSYDYATIKYNSSGVQQWVQRYNGPGSIVDEAYSLAVDGSGNVYVTGYSTGSVTYYDYATIKYSQPVGITPISNQIPEAFRLEQNYPNPFNPSTTIRFSIPASKGDRGMTVRLLIYDVLGREVASLIPALWRGQEGLQPGTYEVSWDASNYPTGVYFYSLFAGDYRETRKMELIK